MNHRFEQERALYQLWKQEGQSAVDQYISDTDLLFKSLDNLNQYDYSPGFLHSLLVQSDQVPF